MSMELEHEVEYPPEDFDRRQQLEELREKLDTPGDLPDGTINHWSQMFDAELMQASAKPCMTIPVPFFTDDTDPDLSPPDMPPWRIFSERDDRIDLSIQRSGIPWPVNPEVAKVFEESKPCRVTPCQPFTEVDLGSIRPVGWMGVDLPVLDAGEPFLSWSLERQVDELWAVLLDQAQQTRDNNQYTDDTLITVRLPDNPKLAAVFERIKARAEADWDCGMIIGLVSDDD
jgi:hypothetical protein